MNESKMQRRKDFLKTMLATTCTIGAVTLGFQGLSQAALAAELRKTETVATDYSINSNVVGFTKQTQVPKSAGKPSYTLVDSDLEYYRDKKPTSLDISRETAAEIGVQGLRNVFGVDMNGKEIEMSYDPAENGYRAKWNGTWWVNGKKKSESDSAVSYYFCVDALSGKLNSLIHDRVLKEGTAGGFNKGLEKNSGEFEALAKQKAVELGLLESPVKTVTYEGQGMANNDPDIFFNLTGENGERAQIRFSRFDKALLGVTYDIGMKEMDVAIKNSEDFAKRAEEYFKQNPNATSYEE